VSDAGEDLFSAFVRGAGLDPAGLKQSNNAETMESYGRLLRIVVEGMMEVLMARASLKSEFRVPLTTIRPVENNPLKFSPNADEALRILFMSRNGGYLPPEAAVAEGFEDVKSHQMAMVAGMQAAFNKMIVRFKPEAIQQLEEADGVRAALKSVNRKSRLWDAYCGFYREMTQDATASFQKLFGDEFARAYESQIQRLVKSRRE
jgi:type VI secretion system protein